MKYIRTQDSFYAFYGIMSISLGRYNPKGKYYRSVTDRKLHRLGAGLLQDKYILKQADTIEELCDEFVIYEKEQNNGFPITCPKDRLHEIKPYIQIGMQKGFDTWLKGAIWTNKGLIYVAKMNDSGVLELL